MAATAAAAAPASVRTGDATYGRPFCDHQGRPMVDVAYDDGDRFVTYAVGEAVLSAWAEVDLIVASGGDPASEHHRAIAHLQAGAGQ